MKNNTFKNSLQLKVITVMNFQIFYQITQILMKIKINSIKNKIKSTINAFF